MADDYKKAQFEALYGPLAEFEVYNKKHGRKKNKMQRKYAVEHKIREMMRRAPADGTYGGSNLSAEQPMPLRSAPANAMPSPTDAPEVGDPGAARMFRETTADSSFNPTNVDAVGNYMESVNEGGEDGEYMDRIRRMREGINSYQSGTVPDSYWNALDEIGRTRGEGAYTRDIPMHANNMRNAARAMYPWLGAATSPLLEGAGLVNEIADYGRGLFRDGSQVGFDPSDMVSNRVGIMQGIQDAGDGPLKRMMDYARRRGSRYSTSRPGRATSIRG